MNARQLGFAATIIFYVTLSAGCERSGAEPAASNASPPEVTTAEVMVRELRDWTEFTGRLEAVSTVDIRPRVSGYVESVHFVEGGRVGEGDLLFQIDPRPFQAQVERLQAELERAKAQSEAADGYRARAHRLLEQNATSVEEVEGLNADAAAAGAQLAAVQAALKAAELDLEFTRVVAPISGRVSRAVITAGNLVDSSALLTTLVSDDPIYAYFDADEQAYLEYAASTPAPDDAGAVSYVGLINEEGHPHVGRLDFIDNRVDPTSGTIRVRLILDNADGRFTPGLFVRIKLVSHRRYEAALVEDRAIGVDLGHKFVLVVDDENVAQYRPVETARLIDGLRVVTHGLERGDVVIVNGLQRVRPGTPVAPTRRAMQTDSPALAQVAGAVEQVEWTVHNAP